MWFSEYVGEQYGRQKRGEIRFDGDDALRRQPAWWVLLKLFGVALLLVVGYALVLPSLPLPWWQSAAAATGILMVYMGVGFFVRCEGHEENMGWAGGLGDDPFQYSDDWNRTLFWLEAALAPGRFMTRALLDACVLCGLVPEDEPEAPPENPAEAPAAPIQPTLRADRFE